MSASFDVYEPNGNSLGTLAVSAGSWQHQAGEDGGGRATLNGDVDAALLAERVIVRVNDGTADRFAFVPTTKLRRQVEGETEVELSGPGVRWLLHAAQVLQEDTSDCAEPASARWFGWMSGDYDDSAWDTPVSFGTHLSGPFVSARPEGWVDPFAEYIWTDEGAFAFGASPPGDVYFRKQFTTATEQDVVICAAADDEFQLFLDGTEIMSTLGGGPYQWERFQQRPIKLCAGTHTLAILGRNLERPLANLNYGWVLASLVPMNSQTGEPEAHDQQWRVYHDHTGGTFTLTGEFGETTSALAFDISAADLQTALEGFATVGAGNVTVSGSGSQASPWIITFTGDLSALRYPLAGNGGSLTGGTGFEVEEDVRGGAADPVVRTDTTWTCLPYPDTAPGLTPGKILEIAHTEAKARTANGVIWNITRGTTDLLDSDGEAWSAELTFPLSLPADMHRLCVLIEEMGFAVDMDPDLTLQCWNDRGADLSATVVLEANTAGVSDVQATRDETTARNTIRYRAGDGWHTLTDSTSVTARGTWEEGLNLDAFPTDLDAQAVVVPTLADLATPQRSTTLTIPSEAGTVPYDDFDMADIVTAPAMGTSGFDATDMRVISIGGRMAELSIEWTVEVID